MLLVRNLNCGSRNPLLSSPQHFNTNKHDVAVQICMPLSLSSRRLNLMLCLALINIDEVLRGLCRINGSLSRASLGGTGAVKQD